MNNGSGTENATYTFISASQSNGLYTLQDLFQKEAGHPLFWKSEQTQSQQLTAEAKKAGFFSCELLQGKPIYVTNFYSTTQLSDASPLEGTSGLTRHHPLFLQIAVIQGYALSSLTDAGDPKMAQHGACLQKANSLVTKIEM